MKQYKVGEYLVHENAGVCQVASIEEKALSGKGSEKLYYELIPIYQSESRVITPVETKVRLRDVKSPDEMNSLFTRVEELEMIEEPNDRVRGEKYKQAMNEFEPLELARVLKTVYRRRLERIAAGKKVMSLDEKVMQMASRKLFEEMSFSLQEDMDSVSQRFLSVLTEVCRL